MKAFYKKGNKPLGIKSQLRGILAFMIVVPILFLGIYMYYVAKNNLIQQTRIAMTGSVDVLATGLDNNCKRENDVIKFFSYKEEFRKVLENASINQYELANELNNDIEPLIWYYLSSDNNIESIQIYSDLIEKEHIGGFLSQPQTDDEKAIYELCRSNYSNMWVTDSEGNVYIVKSLLDSATSSRVVGVVALKVRADSFFSMIYQTGYLANGVLVVAEDGTEIIHKPIVNESLDRIIVSGISNDSFQYNEDNFYAGRRFFVSRSKRLENGWNLYYYVNRSEITSDVISILISDIIIAAFLFAIAYFIATKYANHLSKRITNLNDMAEEIRSGKFDIIDMDNYKDEIGQLSESMTDMSSQLKEMVDEINLRNQEDLLMKENDIHYREWLFDFVVEKNNDILAVLSDGSFSPSFVTSNVQDVLGISMELLKQDIRCLELAVRQDQPADVNLKDVIEKCVTTGEAMILDEIRFENIRTNEHLYYRGVVVNTIDDGGKRTAIALYDRTQEFRRNHQLQEALNAAQTANKAKTSFLANMSHDFRTPMNAITGFNLLIDKNCNDPEKVKEYSYKISLASRNLLGLLNDVLDMSKIESGKTTLDIQEMKMGQLLEEVNTVIGMQAKAKDQEYIVSTQELIHDRFMGDRQRINEILVNILGNAVKYTQEGGKIEFTIEESTTSSEGFNNLRFIIKDNGIGMKPEYKDKIFDAFSREEKGATKTIQGTGLGMAITKSLVELMGGTIRVDSEEGKGSTFTVNLRLQLAGEDEIFWKDRGINSFLGVNSIVEENVFFKEKMAVAELSGDVVTSGKEALDYIKNSIRANRLVDFVIIDENIDDMPLEELIKEIRGIKQNESCIIFVAVTNKNAVEKELLTAGANMVVQKPVLEDTLREAFEEIDEIKAKEDAQKAENTNPLEGMKFLAAEDNDINADILTELMSMEGATVTRGVNGQEVVEMFKAANEGDYDMILMDIQMPVMNGYEAAAAIRALDSEWAQRIPIIAMTANAYADDVQQAFDAGMNAHVTKPIDIKIVEKTILQFKGN